MTRRLRWSGNQKAQNECDKAWEKLKASNARSKAKAKREATKNRLLRRDKERLAKKMLTIDPFEIRLPNHSLGGAEHHE